MKTDRNTLRRAGGPTRAGDREIPGVAPSTDGGGGGRDPPSGVEATATTDDGSGSTWLISQLRTTHARLRLKCSKLIQPTRLVSAFLVIADLKK